MSDDITETEKKEVAGIDVISIAKYINDSLLKMDEVTSFAQVGFTDTVREDIFGIDIPNKGIRVYVHDAGVIIDLYINVRFGVRIPELAWEIQRRIKHSIDAEFSTNIESVNVHIQGVE